MGQDSKIEWCEHTFNAWWGCTKVSEGCKHCYAETFSKRVGYSETGSNFPIWGADAERRFFGDAHWGEPLKWNAAAASVGVMDRVFCGSMCDVLEDYTGTGHLVRETIEESRQWLWRLVPRTPNLLWLFLTKRPENAIHMLPEAWAHHWPRNVMLGVTIENQARLVERMEHVRKIHQKFPGASMFASCEPLLSALDWELGGGNGSGLEFFDWVIAGGESGHGARPAHPSWFRKLRNDCANRTDMGRPWPVPFLFKQWGDWLPDQQNPAMADGVREAAQETQGIRVGKKAAGRLLDGQEHNGIPILTYGPQLQGVHNYGAVEVSA